MVSMPGIFHYTVKAYLGNGQNARLAADGEVNRFHRDYVMDVILLSHGVNADARIEVNSMELVTCRVLTNEEIGTLNAFFMSGEFAKYYTQGAAVPYFLVQCQ